MISLELETCSKLNFTFKGFANDLVALVREFWTGQLQQWHMRRLYQREDRSILNRWHDTMDFYTLTIDCGLQHVQHVLYHFLQQVFTPSQNRKIIQPKHKYMIKSKYQLSTVKLSTNLKFDYRHIQDNLHFPNRSSRHSIFHLVHKKYQLHRLLSSCLLFECLEWHLQGTSVNILQLSTNTNV